MKIQKIDGFSAIYSNNIPNTYMIEAEIFITPQTDHWGFILNSSNDFEHGYYIRFEQRKNTMYFDFTDRICEHPDISRTVKFNESGNQHVRLIVEENIFLVYLNKEYAMSGRMYDHKTDKIAVYCTDGEIMLNKIILKK